MREQLVGGQVISDKSKRTRRLQAMRGFTLLEVLIALLVLAIGLVGIASLHLAGLRNVHSSYYTSIASSVALDFEERLWLAMADINQGCLGQADFEAILLDLEANWGSDAPGSITLPGLRVTPNSDPDNPPFITDASNFWAEARITVSWQDGRFGQGTENFRYTARVVCAPDAVP